MIWGFFFFLPPSLLFPDAPSKTPPGAARGEEGQTCVQCWGFWGVGQSFKKGPLASPVPLGSSLPPSRMGQLVFLPLSPSPGYQILPSSLSCLSTRRFPKAQGRVQHPDLNFNAILAPKASFCCLERKLIRKVLGAPALQDPAQLWAGPALALLLSLLPFNGGGSLCFGICYYYLFFSFQLKGFEGKSDASLSVPGRVCRVPAVAALGGSETFWESRASSPRKPCCNSQLNCFQKPDVFEGKEGRECARDWKRGMVWYTLS